MGAVGSLGNTFRSHSDNPGPLPCILHYLPKNKQDSLLHTHSYRSCRECQQATALWVSLSTLPTPTQTQLQKAFGAQGFISAGIHTFSLSTNAKFSFSCREPGVEFALAVQVFELKFNFFGSVGKKYLVQFILFCPGGAISRHCYVSLGLRCVSCTKEIKPRSRGWMSLWAVQIKKIFFCCC